MDPFNLLAKLKQLNVKVSLAGDRLRLEAPKGVLTPELKETLQQHKPALTALLSGQPLEVEETLLPGVKSKVYRTRQVCLEAGHCLQWSRETDCNLFPLTWCWGWCRERQAARGKPIEARKLLEDFLAAAE